MSGIDWQAVSAVSGAVVGVSALFGMVAFVWRKTAPGFILARKFIYNAMGVPEDKRTGEPGHPSIFEQIASQGEHLGKQDEQLSRQDEQLKIIKHELFTNSGQSLRDQTDKAVKSVSELAEVVASLALDVKGVHVRLDLIEPKISQPRHKKEA